MHGHIALHLLATLLNSSEFLLQFIFVNKLKNKSFWLRHSQPSISFKLICKLFLASMGPGRTCLWSTAKASICVLPQDTSPISHPKGPQPGNSHVGLQWGGRGRSTGSLMRGLLSIFYSVLQVSLWAPGFCGHLPQMPLAAWVRLEGQDLKESGHWLSDRYHSSLVPRREL